MTPLEAAKAVAVLTAAYPAAKWSEETCKAYESALADLDFELARAAFRRLARTHRFPPAISEVVGAALEEAIGPSRSGAEAWGDVVYAVRHVGSYRVPAFRDPIVGRVVDQFGWLNLCLEGGEDAPLRARFCQAYDAAAAAQRAEALARPGMVNELAAARPALGLPPARAIGDLDRSAPKLGPGTGLARIGSMKA